MIDRILHGKHRGPLPTQQIPSPTCGWNAHCPSVPTIKLNAWFEDKRVNEKYKQRMRQLFNQMEHILRTMQQEKTKRPIGPSSISDDVVKSMLDNDIAEELPNDTDAQVNTSVFLIPESKKQRFRVIHWTRRANEVAADHYRWNHDISKQADVMDYIPLVHSATHGATFDLKASFYQIELPEHLRDLFVFKTATRTMRMKRLPMGFSLSCEIVQIFTQSMAEVIANLVRSDGYLDVLTFTHVDNFMFLSNSAAAVSKAIEYTEQLIRDWNVTLSESAATPTIQLKFHALHLNLKDKEVAATADSIEKLRVSESSLHKAMFSGEKVIKMGIIQDSFGFEPLLKTCARLTFWSRVMFRGSNWQTGDFASHFPVMNLIRAAGRLLEKGSDTIKVNRTCIHQMIEWFEALPLKIIVPNLQVDQERILEIFTDASTTGGGYIIQGHPMAFPWPHPVEPKHMGEAELAAILQALRAVSQNDTVRIITDSSIAIGGITNGYSASLRVNNMVRDIIHHIRANRIKLLEIRYINTKHNPADPLSRAIDLHRLRITSILPLAWEWEERAYSLSQDGGALISYPAPVVVPDGTMRVESTVCEEARASRAGFILPPAKTND